MPVQTAEQPTGPATPAPTFDPAQQPESKPATLTAAPAPGRTFPCKACGAHLNFDPTSRALTCPYCGHIEQINPQSAGVRELDFETYLSKQAARDAANQTAIAGRSSEVNCPGCGATILLEDNVVTETCPFCATPLTNIPPQAAQAARGGGGSIQPAGILPFAITSRQAMASFNAWIASRWFAPSDLKQLANLGQLSGIYLPFWTYDSMTYTHYTGQRGDDYWETETYTERDSEGRTQTRTRQVRRTRWHYVSGEVDHFFGDVLVCASTSLPPTYIQKLEPWDLQDLNDFQPAYLAGFRTERYRIGLGDGFDLAQQRMAPVIRSLCTRDIGGDHQQLREVTTQHVGVTFKHILLPIWLAVYRYRNQTYRIMVNARTGELVGDRPYSVGKILLLALLILLAVVVIGMILAGGGTGTHSVRGAVDF
jgi:DNA-directed RNA polymerase subunit RPC12/RpoP